MPRPVGPGPANYLLPPTVGYKDHDATKFRNPMFSMGARCPTHCTTVGPGPSYSFPYNYTRFGADPTPKFTMRPKVADLHGFQTPGPGAHSPELCPIMNNNRPPAYTMAGRTTISTRGMSPGPNVYPQPDMIGPRIPHKTAAPAYTICGRSKGVTSFASPGPAAYDAPNMDRYKEELPRFTMTSRNYPPCGRSASPGPNTYLPLYNMNKEPPKFSFGVRHTEYKTPCVLPEDN